MRLVLVTVTQRIDIYIKNRFRLFLPSFIRIKIGTGTPQPLSYILWCDVMCAACSVNTHTHTHTLIIPTTRLTSLRLCVLCTIASGKWHRIALSPPTLERTGTNKTQHQQEAKLLPVQVATTYPKVHKSQVTSYTPLYTLCSSSTSLLPIATTHVSHWKEGQ